MVTSPRSHTSNTEQDPSVSQASLQDLDPIPEELPLPLNKYTDHPSHAHWCSRRTSTSVLPGPWAPHFSPSPFLLGWHWKLCQLFNSQLAKYRTTLCFVAELWVPLTELPNEQCVRPGLSEKGGLMNLCGVWLRQAWTTRAWTQLEEGVDPVLWATKYLLSEVGREFPEIAEDCTMKLNKRVCLSLPHSSCDQWGHCVRPWDYFHRKATYLK